MIRNDSFSNVEDILTKLKGIVPSAFQDNQLNFDMLKSLLGIDADKEVEKFGLQWLGKSKAIKSTQTISEGTLRPVIDKSSNYDNADNIIIEGDNFEALKLLQKSYYGKIKVIYIDPPYNTGNDLVYQDDYSDPIRSYLEQTQQIDNEGQIISSDIELSGRKHSKWLNMIYPRIVVARNLLTDNGVILVSIDDNEYGHLKEVMDEIFGEEGHLATFVWRRRIGSSMSSSWISADHEYVLAYSKNPQEVYIKGDERDMSKYSIPDENGRLFASMPLTVGMNKSMRPGQWYELRHPETGTGYYPPEGRVWAYYPPTMEEKIKEGKVLFPEDFPDRNMTSPRLKSYPEDAKRERKPLSTWIIEKKTSNQEEKLEDKYQIESPKNEEGTRILKDLIGDSFFTYPKPLTLIKKLLDQFTEKDDIIMDFFAGSGTTAHAVMELNKEDEGHRKYILVQLPEKVEHENFNTIIDITRERIERASEKLGEPTKYKYFTLDSSNFNKWDHNVATPEQLSIQIEAWKDPIKVGRTSEDVMYEVLLKSGFELTARIEKHDFEGSYFFKVEQEGHTILIYVNRDKLSSNLLREIKEMNLSQVWILDEAFNSDDEKKNFELQLKEQSIEFRTI
ncbi:site-specific DNA-methyltransferase [Aneurinibacillus sp. REN35]|uniref:site-specific DNA-methyltransferase n=1 Tax=Aneurinibacillus sp. REN35 TaxID=3237286 RepID=UPI003528B24F